MARLISRGGGRAHRERLARAVVLGEVDLEPDRDLAIKKGYQLSEDTKAVVTDTFDFEVPPKTLREVSLLYKQICQHGFTRI